MDSPSSPAYNAKDPLNPDDEFSIPLPPSSVCSEDSQDSENTGTVRRHLLKPRPAAGKGLGRQSNLDSVRTENHVPDIHVDGTHDLENHFTRTRTSSPGFMPANEAGLSTIDLSLERVARLVQEDVQERNRHHMLQARLERLYQSYGDTSRLLLLLAQDQASLVQQYKTGNVSGFTTQYQAIVKRQAAQDGSRHLPVGQAQHPECRNMLSKGSDLAPSWLDLLPTALRKDIILLVSQLRSDPNFVRELISSLLHADLMSLIRPQKEQKVEASVSSGHGRFFDPLETSQDQMTDHGLAKAEDHTQNLGDNHLDPLSLLLLGIFDDSSQIERRQRLAIWSSVCAHMLSDGKLGSDELTLSVLTKFATLRPWGLNQQLETFIAGVLHEGAFLVDPQEPQPVDFTKPTELRDAMKAIRVSEFFDHALESLFGLLIAYPLRVAVPGGAVDLIRAILKRIPNSVTRRKIRNFILSRWYCSTFLAEILIHPEGEGLLMHQYINPAMRHKILRALALRMQQHVVDVMSPWKQPGLVPHNIERAILQLMRNLDAIEPEDRITDGGPTTGEGAPFFMLSPQETITIFRALYPRKVAQNFSTGVDFESYNSACSSETGSSTVNSCIVDRNIGTSSSVTSSLSGTSMTSASIHEELPEEDQAGQDQFDAGRKSTANAKSKNCTETGNNLVYQIRDLLAELEKTGSHQTSSLTKPTSSDASHWGIFRIIEGGIDSSLILTSAPIPDSLAIGLSDDIDGSIAEPAVESENPRLLSSEKKALKNAISLALGCILEPLAPRLPLTRTSQPSAWYTSEMTLQGIFHDLMTECQWQSDYHESHFWWNALRTLYAFSATEQDLLVRDMYQELKSSIEGSRKSSELSMQEVLNLETRITVQERSLDEIRTKCRALRDKMWYTADVRHSSTYEDASNVTRALKAMSRPADSRKTGVAAWARQRLRTSVGHDNLQAQTIEALAAPKQHGGPGKLANGQVDLTTRWLTKHSIENFCKAEERIHRFCLEVQKCVSKLTGDTLVDSPVLWSSSLYQDEKQSFQAKSEHARSRYLSAPGSSLDGPVLPHSAVSALKQRLPYSKFLSSRFSPRMDGSIFSASQYIDDMVEPLQSLPRVAASGGSLHIPERILLSSGISASEINGLKGSTRSESDRCRDSFLQKLKQKVLSLLLSDLGYTVWNDGSETDVAIFDFEAVSNLKQVGGVAGSLLRNESPNVSGKASKYSSLPGKADFQLNQESDHQARNTDSAFEGRFLDVKQSGSGTEFPYTKACERLVGNFSFTADPYAKLRYLFELNTVIVDCLEDCSSAEKASVVANEEPLPTKDRNNSGNRGFGVPRTKATKLEEVIANCEERRTNTMFVHSNRSGSLSRRHYPYNIPVLATPAQPGSEEMDNVVPSLQKIFSDASIRPKTLFRDLQYIAAFVPSSILDTTPQGKAFWNVGLAALSLKAEVCQSMISRANDIVTYHLSKPKASKTALPPSVQSLDQAAEDQLDSPRVGAPPTTSTEEATPHPLADTPLSVAATLYKTAAMEGDPTAARELALFYLTHPDIVPHVTVPLSRPSEVFKNIPPADNRSSNGSVGAEGSNSGKHKVGSSAGSASTGNGNGNGGGGLDPTTFALAFHWMEFAANAGDKDARAFLKENGDLGRGW